MAKKRGRTGHSPTELRRLEALPQRYESWQVGARQLDMSVQEAGRALRPWVLLVASGEGLILASEVLPEAPGRAEVWATLARGMSSPLAGEPHLPTTVQFADAGWAEALRAPLEALNVAAEVAEMEGLDEALEGLKANVRGGPPAGLLDAEGVTPELVGGVFDAAAVFYRQAPWKRVGERAVEVISDRLEGGPRYAVMMGQAGLTAGLVLYDDYDTLVRIRDEYLAPGEAAAITAALAVIFGTVDELVPADVEAMRAHHWRVAGPYAYPCIYRMEPGMVMRPPTAAELELLEGCLRALPEFARKKTRRLGPAPFTVPGAAGDVALVLAWADG
jgi:hypothetical protein